MLWQVSRCTKIYTDQRKTEILRSLQTEGPDQIMSTVFELGAGHFAVSLEVAVENKLVQIVRLLLEFFSQDHAIFERRLLKVAIEEYDTTIFPCIVELAQVPALSFEELSRACRKHPIGVSGGILTLMLEHKKLAFYPNQEELASFAVQSQNLNLICSALDCGIVSVVSSYSELFSRGLSMEALETVYGLLTKGKYAFLKAVLERLAETGTRQQFESWLAVWARDSNSKEALRELPHCALSNSDRGMFDYMLELADLEQPYGYYDLLAYAVITGASKWISVILLDARFDPNFTEVGDEAERTLCPLMHAMREESHEWALALLLDPRVCVAGMHELESAFMHILTAHPSMTAGVMLERRLYVEGHTRKQLERLQGVKDGLWSVMEAGSAEDEHQTGATDDDDDADESEKSVMVGTCDFAPSTYLYAACMAGNAKVACKLLQEQAGEHTRCAIMAAAFGHVDLVVHCLRDQVVSLETLETLTRSAFQNGNPELLQRYKAALLSCPEFQVPCRPAAKRVFLYDRHLDALLWLLNSWLEMEYKLSLACGLMPRMPADICSFILDRLWAAGGARECRKVKVEAPV